MTPAESAKWVGDLLIKNGKRRAFDAHAFTLGLVEGVLNDPFLKPAQKVTKANAILARFDVWITTGK